MTTQIQAFNNTGRPSRLKILVYTSFPSFAYAGDIGRCLKQGKTVKETFTEIEESYKETYKEIYDAYKSIFNGDCIENAKKNIQDFTENSEKNGFGKAVQDFWLEKLGEEINE